MKKLNVGPYKLSLYDDIDDMPMKRFHQFNKYLLIDSGVGSDLDDINRTLASIMRSIHTKNLDRAKTELGNVQQAIMLVSAQINPKHLSFVPLVHSINGKPLGELTDDRISELSELFKNAKVSVINRSIESVKKKIDEQLIAYFPADFDSAKTKEYYEKLNRRTKMVLDEIINGSTHTEEINRIDELLLGMYKPREFYGKGSQEIKYNKDYEETKIMLNKELGINVDSISVMQFYIALDQIKKMNKSNKSASQSRLKKPKKHG